MYANINKVNLKPIKPDSFIPSAPILRRHESVFLVQRLRLSML